MRRLVLTLTLLLGLCGGMVAQSDFRVIETPAWPRPAAILGQAFTLTYSIVGGYPAYSPWIVHSNPPPGLTFDAATGRLSGTPTVVGNYIFAIGRTCCNGLGSAAVDSTIKVVGPLAILTTSLPGGYPGAAYSFQFTAGGGVPPYWWAIDDAFLRMPAGMNLDPLTGTLSGTGSGNQDYNFTVSLYDSELRHVSKAFTLRVYAKPQIVFNNTDVKFSSSASGPAQSAGMLVGTSSGESLDVTITPDTPKPDWIKVEPPQAKTPVEAKIQVDPAKAPSLGSHTTTVTVTDKSGVVPPVPIKVTLEVLYQPPKLEFAPADVRFFAGASETAPKAAYLMVRNGGSGFLDVSAAVTGQTPWLAVAPKTVTAAPEEWAAFSVTANPASLSQDASSGMIHLTSLGGNADVPVSLVKEGDRPQLETSFQGLQFYGRPGQAATAPQEIEVRNTGTGSIFWQASLIVDQGNFLVTPLSGHATSGSPTKMTIQARPLSLATGIHYGLLRIGAAAQDWESTQDVALVVNVVPTSTAMPELAPEGLIFLVRPGTMNSTQELKVYTDSSSAVDFAGSTQISNPELFTSSWLSVTPSSGKVSSSAPASLSVNISAFGVKSGVYTGKVTVGFSGVLMRSIPVTLIVSDAAPVTAQASFLKANLAAAQRLVLTTTRPASQFRVMAGWPAPLSAVVSDEQGSPISFLKNNLAAAQRLVLTTTRPASQFRVMAGWPVPLSAVVSDEQGSPMTDADLNVIFSNGDAALPMSLSNVETGLYTATWIPAAAGGVTLSMRAARDGLAVQTAELFGTVEGSAGAPVVTRNGVLNHLNGVVGAPLAPGTLAAIRGTALASQTAIQTSVPLPAELGGTRVYIGGREAPLYYVLPEQIAVQVPTELVAGTPQAVTVVRNGAVSVPTILNLAKASPGIAAFADGTVGAQHSDYTLITASAPAHPGESIILYLVGMGATDVAVATGQQAPASPAANVQVPATVTIDGAPAQVDFAGLTPGVIGLYQILCRVPDSARAGDLTLIVTQNGVSANSVVIPVTR